MAGRRGLFVRKDATAGTGPQDARLALAGLLTPAGPLGVVPGVLSGCAVTGTSGWAYEVGAGHYVTTRGASDGAVLAAVDGPTATDAGAVGVAPASGSRWDLIWVRQRDVDAGDSDSKSVVGVTSGTSGGSPSKPYGSVPAGALVLAEAQVASGATQTSHANVTITNVAPWVAARGGIIPVPNVAARQALAAASAPTSARPLYVDRADAPLGSRLEVTADGVTFVPVVGSTLLTATPSGATFGGGGGTLGITSAIAVESQPFARRIRLDFAGMPSTLSSGFCEVTLRRGSTGVRSSRPSSANSTASGSYTEDLAAGQSASYQLVATTTAAAGITNNPTLTYLTATVGPA